MRLLILLVKKYSWEKWAMSKKIFKDKLCYKEYAKKNWKWSYEGRRDRKQ